MIVTKRGRPRKLTDDQCRQIKTWRPLHQLAKEFGVTSSTAKAIRRGYRYKQVSP